MATELKTVANPFAQGTAVMPQSESALAATDQARAIAEVQAALVVARMNPRDPVRAMDRIINACQRPTLANSATYAYARGGTQITGPSIRLAEALAQAWGNIQYGIREISQSQGVSTVAAYAWDVETNTRREMVFQVAHRRDTKRGSYDIRDGRDIYELVANQGARRLRACILAIIPGDVTEAALAQCAATQQAHVDMTPEGIKALADTFAQFGVTKAQIEKRIQRRLESILPAQVISMRNIYRSLKDGMSAPEDWFEPEEKAASTPAPKGAAGLKSKLKKKAAEPLPPPDPAPVEAPQTPAPDPIPVSAPGDVIPDPNAVTAQQIDPADRPDAGAPESDPWLDAFDAARQ